MHLSPITTHILDTTLGKPDADVTVRLWMGRNGTWEAVAEATTDKDGRINYWLGEQERLCGDYRIEFEVKEYFQRQKVATLYPRVDIYFTVTDANQHYHIPLLITANGYSTYRGS